MEGDEAAVAAEPRVVGLVVRLRAVRCHREAGGDDLCGGGGRQEQRDVTSHRNGTFTRLILDVFMYT